MRNREIPQLLDEDRAFVQSLLIFENETLLAFNKPSGLATQTRGNRGRSLDLLLWAYARSNGKRPRLVHRLDAGTSGIIVAAKTKPAAAFLSAQFEKRTVKKTYLAVCGGTLPQKDEGVWETGMRRVGERGLSAEICAPEAKGAAPALTRYRMLSRAGDKALVEASPETGRMHQIRVHLAAAGCPILGDRIYGDAESAPRLMLHAAALELSLADGKALTVSAPLPDDFRHPAEASGLQLPAFGST